MVKTVSIAEETIAKMNESLAGRNSKINDLESELRTETERADATDAELGKTRDALEPHRADLAALRAGLRGIEALADAPFTRGNDLKLLVNGETTFDAICEGIGLAQDYVLVEFYILRDDEVGRRLKDALLDRARAGV